MHGSLADNSLCYGGKMEGLLAICEMLKTNTTLTTLLFDGNLSAVAAELSVELAIQRALRQ